MDDRFPISLLADQAALEPAGGCDLIAEWRVDIGDLAVQYHTCDIGLVVSMRVEPQGGSKILLLRCGDYVWVDRNECFRWQPIRSQHGGC